MIFQKGTDKQSDTSAKALLRIINQDVDMSSLPVAESSGLYRQLLRLHGISTKMRELMCIGLGQGGNYNS